MYKSSLKGWENIPKDEGVRDVGSVGETKYETTANYIIPVVMDLQPHPSLPSYCIQGIM